MSYQDLSDQTEAQLQGALNKTIHEHRSSLARKKERHGDQFTNRLALQHFMAQLGKLSGDSKTVLLAAAINRLAQMDDFIPPFLAEIAELDFDPE